MNIEFSSSILNEDYTTGYLQVVCHGRVITEMALTSQELHRLIEVATNLHAVMEGI
jgi:hypothetical protein